jgi:hypothetical protein
MPKDQVTSIMVVTKQERMPLSDIVIIEARDVAEGGVPEKYETKVTLMIAADLARDYAVGTEVVVGMWPKQ